MVLLLLQCQASSMSIVTFAEEQYNKLNEEIPKRIWYLESTARYIQRTISPLLLIADFMEIKHLHIYTQISICLAVLFLPLILLIGIYLCTTDEAVSEDALKESPEEESNAKESEEEDEEEKRPKAKNEYEYKPKTKGKNNFNEEKKRPVKPSYATSSYIKRHDDDKIKKSSYVDDFREYKPEFRRRIKKG